MQWSSAVNGFPASRIVQKYKNNGVKLKRFENLSNEEKITSPFLFWAINTNFPFSLS